MKNKRKGKKCQISIIAILFSLYKTARTYRYASGGIIKLMGAAVLYK